MFYKHFPCYYSYHIAFCRPVILRLLNCITGTVQLTKGGKFFPRGPHVRLPWATVPGRHVTVDTTMAPNICASLLWTVPHIPLLMPGMLWSLVDFWKHLCSRGYVEIKCQLGTTDDFYCRSYCSLNMFRGTIMPIIRSSRVLYKWLLPVVFGALVLKLSVWCGTVCCVSGLRPAAAARKPDT